MDSNGAFLRRIDAAFVARGGVLLTFDSISTFLGSVDVEPDKHTIQRFLKQTVVRDEESATCVSSAPLARDVRRVLVGDCVELAKQCLEVSRRRLVGGNEEHYLQLAWVGCGGDEGRKGSIHRSALLDQLAAIGVETGNDSPAGGYSSDADDAPTMTFNELVGLVSVSKDVLETAARCADPSKLEAVKGSNSLSSEEAATARMQTIALIRFKLRLRAVLSTRRLLRERVRRKDEEASAALGRTMSLRFTNTQHRSGGGQHRHNAQQSGASYPSPLPSTRRSSVAVVLSPHTTQNTSPSAPAPIAVAVKAVRSLRQHRNGAGSVTNEQDGSNLMRAGEPADDPDVLHVDTSSSPWHFARPFGSTKLATDWISHSPPPPQRRAPSMDVDESREASSPSRHYVPGAVPLNILRGRLAQLLREQVDANRTVGSGGGHDPHSEETLNGRDCSASIDEQGSDVISCAHHLHVTFSDSAVVGEAVSAARFVKKKIGGNCQQRSVACQCREVEMLLELYGDISNVPKQLKQRARLFTSVKTVQPKGAQRNKERWTSKRLPPLPHSGRF
jgi:hypothetical protein